jgi:hypothetical protein
VRLPTLLIALALLEGIAWSVVEPPLADPSERAQVAYSQHVAETGHKPSAVHGQGFESGEQARYARINGADAIPGSINGRPPYDARQRRALAATTHGMSRRRDDGSGPNPAATNPPGLALVDAVPYLAGRTVGGSFGLRLVLMRLLSVALFALAAWLTWLLAIELLGPAPWPAALAAATVVLLPGLSARAGVVSPEPLLAVEFAASLLAALRLVRLGPSPMRAAALAATVAAGALTNGRALALVVPAAAAALWCLRGRPAVRRVALSALAGGAVLAVGAVAVRALSPSATGGDELYGGTLRASLRGLPLKQLVSWTWQEYLPRIGFMVRHPGPHGLRTGIVAGLLDPPGVAFGNATLTIGSLALLSLVALLAVTAWRRRRTLRRPATGLVALTALAGLAVLHIARLHDVNLATEPVLGALALPLVPLLGLAVGAVAAWLPPRAGARMAGAVVSAGIVVQVAALVLTAGRFNA